MIDLQELNYKDKIIIDKEIKYSKEEYEQMDINGLENVYVTGKITCDLENNYVVNLEVTGKMLLHDSITYDLVDYPFEIEIEETLENSLKTLDLNEFLWHYIVLEVPIRFTKSEPKMIENENFRVISEEEYVKKNNPFSDFSIEREE